MGLQGATTGGAGPLRTRDGIGVLLSKAVMKNTAGLALKEWGPPLHREEGNKKKGEVVIHPFEACPVQAASCTHPGMVFKDYPLRLNSSNKKTHRKGISMGALLIKDNIEKDVFRLVRKFESLSPPLKLCYK